MEYAEIPAPAALRPFVEGFWFLRAEPKARYEKILPGPSAHLILNLSEPYRLIRPREATGMDRASAEVAAGFYAGVQSSYLISENPERLHNVGVRLAPFALAAFTSQLPSEFQGNVVDAQYVFPGFADLRSQLLDAEPEQAFDALESFLLGHLSAGYEADPRTMEAVETLAEEDVEIGSLAGRLGISSSTQERIMMRDCGLRAKVYSDVCRFFRFVNQAALMPAGSAPGRELLGLADYYDQPHLIRAFRRFSGFTPTEYLRVIQTHGPEYATFVPVEELA